jgi:hypothetical protein
MLNPNTNLRELCYIVKIDSVEPISGKDRVECAKVGGWSVMVQKDQFKANDLGIYFEIDSKVPNDEPFAFLASKNFKIKTQKYSIKDNNGKKIGNFYSQGLLMSADDFGGIQYQDGDGQLYLHFGKDSYFKENIDVKEGDFLTEKLNVTYSVEEDNKRKADKNPDAKINAVLARHPQFAKKYGKIVKKNKLLRWFFTFIWGKKKDSRSWPSHIAAKTDVERIQNMMYILQDKQPYVATEKIDGSSCSIMAERGKFGKINYYVCSRNVVFEDENQPCYYDDNIYFEAYKKYNLKEKITQILNDYNLPNIALQMEVFGSKIQRRDYSLNEHQAMVFHIVSDGKKMPMDKVVEICEKYEIPHVPVIDDNFIFPDTLDELQEFVEGEGSKIDGKPREGIVFYDKATGQTYTKFVSPEFLMKFHS